MDTIKSYEFGYAASSIRSVIKKKLETYNAITTPEDAEQIKELADVWTLLLRCQTKAARTELLKGCATPAEYNEEDSPFS